jgi:catechol 2,3-dioxygenase-like lactoylglutathione lyase family enzyme
MTDNATLGQSKLVAFVPTTDYARARTFYEGVLGLHLLEDETPFALVFDAHGTVLRVTKVGEQHTPAPFTVLGWHVESIGAVVKQLTAAGIEFLRFPGLNDNDAHGIWTAPGGALIAWFHDPDGNVLSLTEFPNSAA